MKRLLILLPIALWPANLKATGFEEPPRWLEQSEKPVVLEAPEFFFELELKRLAAELNPGIKAVVASGREGERTYEEQTNGADVADFADALAKKVITPPDAEAAKKAHEEMRRLIVAEMKSDAANPPAKLPEEFPSEFADYHRGALNFHGATKEEAQKAWQALLARPANERHYRTVWATYMLGKMAVEDEEWETVRKRMQETRKAVADGFADTLGLAAASFGWEAFANLHDDRLSEAATLYLQQLATGDITAVYSLKTVLGEALGEGNELEAIAGDPVLQRIVTAGAVSGVGPYDNFAGGTDSEGPWQKWLAVLEKTDAKNVRDADRVAWIAYSDGKFANAARWLKRADPEGPYALWLNAKFALRAGKRDEAARLLAKAVPKMPVPGNLESRYVLESELSPDCAARADLAALQLGRADFLTALQLFIEAGLQQDAAYIAEGVLTIDELKKVVAKLPPRKTNAEGEAVRDDSLSGWDFLRGEIAGALQQILARRLVRTGRYAEARPILYKPQQEVLDEFLKHVETANKPNVSKADKITELQAASDLVLEKGDALFNFDDPIVTARRVSGKQVDLEGYPVIEMKYGKPAKLEPPVSKTERDRLKKNLNGTVHRIHSAYVAADLAWRATLLMPDNDEDTARALNDAGGILKYRDDSAADRFYQAIERRCPKTKLGQAAIKRHWFVPAEDVEALYEQKESAPTKDPKQ